MVHGGGIVTSLRFFKIKTMGTFKLQSDFIGKLKGDIIHVPDSLDNDMIRYNYGVKIDDVKVEVPSVNKAVIPVYNPKKQKR